MYQLGDASGLALEDAAKCLVLAHHPITVVWEFNLDAVPGDPRVVFRDELPGAGLAEVGFSTEVPAFPVALSADDVEVLRAC